ncbi:hypothetical protein BGZ58_010157, partial [Dissophora ornata]
MNREWRPSSTRVAGSTRISSPNTLDTSKRIIITSRTALQLCSEEQGLRRMISAGSASGRHYSSITMAPLLRLDTPVHSRQLSRPLAGVSAHPSIPPRGPPRRVLSTFATPSSKLSSSTKRSSSSSASTVSQNTPSGSTPTQPSSAPPSTWQFPPITGPTSRRSRPSHHFGPLPLPIALKVRSPPPLPFATNSSFSLTGKSSTRTSTLQLKFPHPPAVLGSQPLYYLAKKFPLLAEQELIAIPNKTALDYSSFLAGAMKASYPSATTLRAVVRQFRNFLKESAGQLKESPSSSTYLELPRARIWSLAIRGLIWLKQYRRARVAIYAMQKLGIKPTGFAWRQICRGWIDQGELDRAEALAAKVFTRPEISHDYTLEEKPYYFTDMRQADSSSSTHESSARQKHRSPMTPNSAPLFLVIEALVECGEMERARHWFDQIPEHEMTDMLTSDMVAGYLKVGQQDKAQEVIRIMARCGVKPTAIVFNPIVEHAVKNMDMGAAEGLVKDMLELGIFLNLFTFKILLRGYIATGQKDKALECLERMRASGIETDRVLGRILLDGFWNVGELRKGDNGQPSICNINRTQEMRHEIELEGIEFVGKPGWGQRCTEWIQSHKFELVEEALLQSLSLGGSRLDVETVQVIKALADEREMTRARYWFDRLVSSSALLHDDPLTVDLVNHMVSGYVQVRQPEEAEAVIRVASQHGAQLTVDTINLMLQWSILQTDMQDTVGLVQRMTQSGISPNQQTFEILCQGYASRGALESLHQCLTEMEEAGFGHPSPPTEELRNILLGQQDPHSSALPSSSEPFSSSILDTLCAQWIGQGQMAQADQLVTQLQANPNVPANKIPYVTLIQGWIDQSQRNTVSSSAIQAVAESRSSSRPSRQGLSSENDNPRVATSSSSVPSSQSLNEEFRRRQESVAKIRKARFWFDKVPEAERTIELLNRMVGGYMALGLEQESEGLIQWMAAHKVKPDVVTYNHMLEHTVLRLAMPAAEGLVSRMQRGGIAPNVDTWNLMIRGYVIRGQLGEALQCLDRMTHKKASSSLVPSLNRKAKTREAIETYDREILDAVMDSHDEKEEEEGDSQRGGRFVADPSVDGVVEPNEMTEQLILSGFGPEMKPVQGEGDYGRALELYRNRVARQRQQKNKLLQGLLSLSQQQQGPLRLRSRRVGGGSEEEEEEEWILDHLQVFQELGGLSGSDVGMTDLDWRNELKWEEMMEMERERERELSGRDWSV